MLRRRTCAGKTTQTDVGLHDTILRSDIFSTLFQHVMNLLVVPPVPDVMSSVRMFALGSGSEMLHLKSVAEHFLVHSVSMATLASYSSRRQAEAEGNVFIRACVGSGCCCRLQRGGRFHDVAAPRGSREKTSVQAEL